MASRKPISGDQQRQWVAQWKKAARALSDERAKDLREMTAEQASVPTEAVLDLAASLPLRPGRETHSGLVELQAYLNKLKSK